MTSNKALHLTAIPLALHMAAGELGRYVVNLI